MLVLIGDGVYEPRPASFLFLKTWHFMNAFFSGTIWIIPPEYMTGPVPARFLLPPAKNRYRDALRS
jgi:hypothetical protein